MINKISRKISISLIALFVYATLVSSFISLMDDKKQITFLGLWFTFFMLAAPVFIVAGLIVLQIFEHSKLKEIHKALIITIFGSVIILPYCAYIFDVTINNFYYYMIFGLIGGIVFFSVQYLIEKYGLLRILKE